MQAVTGEAAESANTLRTRLRTTFRMPPHTCRAAAVPVSLLPDRMQNQPKYSTLGQDHADVQEAA